MKSIKSINWKSVKESSQINAVHYDEKKKDLYVRFNNQAVYNYLNVPKKVYVGLLETNSVGSYFHKNIKNSFKFKKLEDE